MDDWRTLAAAVDAAVSSQFGERVRIVPMRSEGYEVPVPDPARSSAEITAVFEQTDGVVMNATADHPGMPFQSRVAMHDAILHVLGPVPAGLELRQHDAVEMLERGGDRYEVARPPVSVATGGVTLYLVRNE